MPAVDSPGLPSFIIRDLDKDPHEIAVPFKILDVPSQQLDTPRTTPDNSPGKGRLDNGPGMVRSISDLSAYSSESDYDPSQLRSGSSLSLRSAVAITSLFRWKKPSSGASTNLSIATSTGIHSPVVDEGMSGDFFATDGVNAKNLNLLASSIQAQRHDTAAALVQLQEERKLRHLAEDRLTEVEEEVSRLCTVILPTDNGETGEAYFASVIHSVRLALESYETRFQTLEKQVEEKSAQLVTERRERTLVDIECSSLRKQLQLARAAEESHSVREVEGKRIEELAAQNRLLQEQLDAIKQEASSHSARTKKLQEDVQQAESSKQQTALVLKQQDEDRTAMLQKIKDIEAQRDALRQVSQGLRQRLTIETRKNTEKLRALQVLDSNITHATSRTTRCITPVSASSSTFSKENSWARSRYPSPEFRSHQQQKQHVDSSLFSVHTDSRPRIERFVTAREIPSSSNSSVVSL